MKRRVSDLKLSVTAGNLGGECLYRVCHVLYLSIRRLFRGPHRYCSSAARAVRIRVGLDTALGAVPEFREGGHSALKEWAWPSRAEWAWS